jgi:hypothetical protein
MEEGAEGEEATEDEVGEVGGEVEADLASAVPSSRPPS